MGDRKIPETTETVVHVRVRERCFIVSQPSYENENIDSVWLDEREAEKRAAELGEAFISEYLLDSPNAWVQNGWYTKGPVSEEDA